MLHNLPLARSVQLGIVGEVLVVACGSAWSPGVRSVAGPLRWWGLGGLCLLALAYAIAEGRMPRPVPAAYALAGALLAVGLVSAFWSVQPNLTLDHWVSFGTVIVTAVAVSVTVAGSEEATARILVAVLAGAALVGVVGLVVYLASPDSAVQAATTETPARYRGLGQNPNTVAMLLAAGMPIAVWLIGRRGWAARAVVAAALLLLAGSVVASGSRTAIAAGFGTAVIPAVLLPRTPGLRIAGGAAAIGALALAFAISEVPSPNPEAHAPSVFRPTNCTPRDAECRLRLEDELGRPSGFRRAEKRGLLGSSGRLEAWQGALDQGTQRPLLGFGFGTEGEVFVDRYYRFEGGLTENSFVGFFLQLGSVGLLLLVALLVSILGAAAVALRRLSAAPRATAGACLAVLVVGLILAFSQSFLYAAGNTATLSVWICAFLLPALAGRRADVV